MKETRIVLGEVRAVGAASKAMRVSGIAARYNSPTTIGRGSKMAFREVLLPGAFRKAVEARQDTAFLVNHDDNRLMGRVSAGTLRLRDTADGLCFECDFPDTEDARSAYESIKRGDMHGCSFRFGTEVGDDKWSVEDDDERGRVAVRKIHNVAQLDDVSAVVFPAYPNTSVSARFENRSEIEIPEAFRVEEVSDETAADVIRRRRQLLDTVL